MSEQVDTLKCPFRQKDGEFCDCYKEKCMAYFNMSVYALHPEKAPETHGCKKLGLNSPFVNGCAI